MSSRTYSSNTSGGQVHRHRGRAIAMVAIAVVLLVACRHYGGPGAWFAHAHGANISFSFGAFFIVAALPLPGGGHTLAAFGYALTAVWLQALLQRVGLYPGTFDPWDFLSDGAAVVSVRTEIAGTFGGVKARSVVRFTRVRRPLADGHWQVIVGQSTLVSDA